MKPTSTYKMKKETKMILGRIKDKQLRDYWKRLLIEAQVSANSSERVIFK